MNETTHTQEIDHMETRLVRWDEHARCVEIYIEFCGLLKRFVMISQCISLADFRPERAMVNWSAIGAVLPSTALVAAAALVEAVRVAEEMERVEEWGRITPPAKGLRWEGSEAPEVHIQDGKAWVDTDGWVPEIA